MRHSNLRRLQIMSLLGTVALLPLAWGGATNFCWEQGRYLSDYEFKTLAVRQALLNWSSLDPTVSDDLAVTLTPDNCCYVDRIPFRGVGVMVHTYQLREFIRKKPEVMDALPLLFSPCGDYLGPF